VSDDAKQVLERDDVDAVVIATPAATHFDLGRKALLAGKHILVEKPMATSVGEVEELGGIAAQKKLTAMVGHTFIYENAVRFIKQSIEEGVLGQVRYMYSQRLNLGRIRSDVDALWNFAPHDVSIMQFLLGDPNPLHVARNGMAYIQKGVEDVTFLNITYPNKVIANIHVSWLDPHRTRKLVIVGSDAMAVYDDTQKDKLQIHDKGIDRFHVLGEGMAYDGSTRPLHFENRSGKVHVPEIPPAEPLAQEIDHFFDCVLGRAECLTGPLHAARVLRILSWVAPKVPTQSLDRAALKSA
jgi:predicted dehydrogenase